ncbi:acylphosphatase [Microbacterium sp. KNMS]
MRRVRVTVGGTVQGIGVRWAVEREAEQAGLAGWVRNVGADRVEAELEGPAQAVGRVAEWMRHGPPGARVTSYDVDDLAPTGQPGFAIRDTT